MREHTFRGKRRKASLWLREDPWVKGSLIDAGDHEQIAIFPPIGKASFLGLKELFRAFAIAVDPDTVGEGTGITDDHGNEIFEGDLVTMQRTKKEGLPGVVKYSRTAARFEIQRVGFNPIPLDGEYDGYIICGNIHDSQRGGQSK